MYSEISFDIYLMALLWIYVVLCVLTVNSINYNIISYIIKGIFLFYLMTNSYEICIYTFTIYPLETF